MTEAYWAEAEPGIAHEDRDVHVGNRMTEYEAGRFKDKADRLLENKKDKHVIKRWQAYGRARLIGAFMSITDDPLNNGIITENYDDFSVAAVQPIDHETVYVRFRYEGDLDTL